MSVLPALALRGKIIFPKTSSFFEVSSPKSIKALEEAMNTNQRIFLLAQKSAAVENPDKDDLYQVGTIVKIQQMVKVDRMFSGFLRRARREQSRSSLSRLSSYSVRKRRFLRTVTSQSD